MSAGTRDPLADAGRTQHPLVLLYHSISSSDTDPWGVRVSPDSFAAQIEFLATRCTPMRLAELHQAVRDRTVPPRAVAVTFDDGYVDNLLSALPILQRFDVPATVFVASGYVDRTEEYWWDEIDRLLLLPGRMTRQVHVDIGNRSSSWMIGSDAWLPWPRWKWQRWRRKYFAYEEDPRQVAGFTPRQKMHRPLWDALRKAPSSDARERALSHLREHAHPSVRPRPANMCVSSDQLRKLAASPLIEIGGHTYMHPSLGFLSRELQREEIRRGKHTLESLLDRKIESFAYPFGGSDDYNQVTMEEVEGAGYSRACTNEDPREIWDADVSRYRIPRHIVQDWAGADFAQQIDMRFKKFGRGSLPVDAAARD